MRPIPAASFLICVTVVCFAVPGARAQTAPGATPSADESITFTYVGELVDEGLRPISGVFPLTFKLYDAERSTAPMWTERQFVAAIEGRYEVVMGREEPLVPAYNHRTVFLAVELPSTGELTRNRVEILSDAERRASDPSPELTVITFADIADRALEADEARHAEDCSTLGGRRLEELDRYEDLLSRIAELRDQVGDGGGGARVGGRTQTLQRIGGAGGNPYTRTCPPGYVVTGARGGHGDMIDSIELICSPIESGSAPSPTR